MTDPKDITRHTIVFPRYREDIEAQRRTLFHWVDMDEVFEPGHRLLIPPHHNFPRASPAVVIKVDKVRLQDVTDEDLAKIGVVWQDVDADDRSPREAARAAYWSRWDAANPEALAASNPLVQRVEFRYGWPEEGPRAA
jgi:hypothetical protein